MPTGTLTLLFLHFESIDMKRYQGTKRLSATPMTRGEYNTYRGWAAPEGEDQTVAGYLVEYEDGGKANDSRHQGYISWSPADVFERSYHEIDASFVQPKITGYRQLSHAEVDLMNEGKALAEQCGAYIAKLRTHNGVVGDSWTDEAKAAALCLDQRWISIGATDLQRGFMAVIRGIAQPTTF